MDRLSLFADRRPALFVLLLMISWILVVMLFGWFAVAILGLSFTSNIVQSIATLAATGCLLIVAGKLGWLGKAGFTRLGGWQVWALTLGFLIYLVPVYLYSFFGAAAFDLGNFPPYDEAQTIITRQLVVGFVEESVFRGVLLYALFRVWGKTRRGVFASVLLPGLIFAVLHVLQIFVGNDWASIGVLVLNSMMDAVWWGAIVLRWKSIWPVVVIHAVTNAVVNMWALTTQFRTPAVHSYWIMAILTIPPFIWGVWILWNLGESNSQIVPSAVGR